MGLGDVKDDLLQSTSATKEPQPRPKRKRWGEKLPASGNAVAQEAAPEPASIVDPKAKILAMQESIRARLAAAKAQQTSSNNSTLSSLLKRPAPNDVPPSAPAKKRAKVYELDLSVTAPTYSSDKAGVKEAPKTVSSAPKTVSRVQPTEAPPPVNPYLLYSAENAADLEPSQEEEDTAIDPRLARTAKVRQRHKEFRFIEPGKYQEIAATKREKELNALASGFMSGRKTGHSIVAPTLASLDTYTGASTSVADDDDLLLPRPDCDDSGPTMPVAMEWWDIELLPSKLKKAVAAEEAKLLTEQTTKRTKLIRPNEIDGDTNNETSNDETERHSFRRQCYQQASLSYSKTAALVQHIVPIQPPNLVAAESNQKQLVLHLTKKELKRQRKLRRQEKQREQQDLQAAGLIPAPEPRLTLRNFIQVLGDQAFLDPSQIEQKVQEQMLARQKAHLQRNEAAKLTKEQRAAKRARKLEEDTTTSVTTALFYVKDMSHPYHRTKVDLNAQQWNLSGCVLECSQEPSFAYVIVEGGPKAIKRYTRLMLVRMKWTGPENAMDEDEDVAVDTMEEEEGGETVVHKFNPQNRCEAVWQGLSVKRLFHGFLFQACETHDQGRKLLKTKGASHYWDQVLQHALQTGPLSSLKVKLHNYDESDDDEEMEREE
jgi:U4/U6 small nuclear ribonucleoprotein PRP3